MKTATATGATTRVTLGELLILRNEIVHPRDNPSGPDVFVGLEHVESGTGRRIGSEPIEKTQMTGRKARFRAGDIVYGYLRPYLNKVWVADFDGLCSVDQYVYRVDPHRVDADYLAWFMRSPLFLSRAPVDSGPGQLPRIRLNEIAQVEIDLPPLVEQRRHSENLAGHMSAAARTRAPTQSQLDSCARLWRCEADQHFLGDEASSCPTAPLRDIAVGNGQYGTSTRSNADEQGLPILGMPNIGIGTIRWAPLKHVDLPDAEMSKYRLVPGDLLFNRTNSAEWVGKSAVYRDDRSAVFASYVVRFRIDGELALPEYVCALINSTRGRRFIEAHMTRAIGQVNISAATIGGLDVSLPPLAEQHRVVERLDAVQAQATRIQEAAARVMESTRLLEAAFLRRAFGGGSPTTDEEARCQVS